MSTKYIPGPHRVCFTELKPSINKIKDAWSLCGLFEGTENACEAEHIVATTFRAIGVNKKKTGESHSFKGKDLEGTSAGGLVKNGPAYQMLLAGGYLLEGEHEGRTVIFITEILLDLVESHFAKAIAKAEGGK